MLDRQTASEYINSNTSNLNVILAGRRTGKSHWIVDQMLNTAGSMLLLCNMETLHILDALRHVSGSPIKDAIRGPDRTYFTHKGAIHTSREPRQLPAGIPRNTKLFVDEMYKPVYFERIRQMVLHDFDVTVVGTPSLLHIRQWRALYRLANSNVYQCATQETDLPPNYWRNLEDVVPEKCLPYEVWAEKIHFTGKYGVPYHKHQMLQDKLGLTYDEVESLIDDMGGELYE